MSTTAPLLAVRYAAAFAGSAARFERAKTLFPTGVTHDTRMMDPFPPTSSGASRRESWPARSNPSGCRTG